MLYVHLQPFASKEKTNGTYLPKGMSLSSQRSLLERAAPGFMGVGEYSLSGSPTGFRLN